MYKVILLFVLLISVSNGCDFNEPVTESDSYITIIDTNNDSFSFINESFIKQPNSENIILDFKIYSITKSSSTPYSVYFSTVRYHKAFNLLKELSTKEAALEYFVNLTGVPETRYIAKAYPVRINQVWAIKTHDNKYGKILILEVKELYYPETNKNYSMAKFKQEYQPNGSSIFN